MQHIIFYARVHLWLVDHSFDRAIKTLCCL